MESIVAYTEEIDDLGSAVSELMDQVKDFKLLSESLAIVFVGEDTEYHELYRRLREHWDFPIIGSTALSMFLGEQGQKNSGISILLLSADDAKFSAGMTGELNYDNYISEIGDKYSELKAVHTEPVKLIISYGGIIYTDENVAGDHLVDALDRASGGVPVYGATASDSFVYDNIRLYYNDEETMNGQVIALISGNIEPRFIATNSVTNRANFSYDVMESKGNVVSRVGDEAFIDVLKKHGMETEKTDVFVDYLLSPFLVDIKKDGDDIVEAARCLTLLDKETGAGSFLGVIPEGAGLDIGTFSISDVETSVTWAFDRAFEYLRTSGRNYKTLLCTSCCARFLALGTDVTIEVEAYKGRLPDGVSLIGIYGNGEYCPIRAGGSGRQYNMFHNVAFTILVM